MQIISKSGGEKLKGVRIRPPPPGSDGKYIYNPQHISLGPTPHSRSRPVGQVPRRGISRGYQKRALRDLKIWTFGTLLLMAAQASNHLVPSEKIKHQGGGTLEFFLGGVFFPSHVGSGSWSVSGSRHSPSGAGRERRLNIPPFLTPRGEH